MLHTAPQKELVSSLFFFFFLRERSITENKGKCLFRKVHKQLSGRVAGEDKLDFSVQPEV